MDASRCSRGELQKLAKANGVRANAKSTFIISELQKKGVLSAVKSLNKTVPVHKSLQNKTNLTQKRKSSSGKQIKEHKKRRRSGMTKSVRDQLTCPVCLITMRGHIHQCAKGHVICEGCFNHPSVIRCPTCRCPNMDVRCLVLEQLAAKLIVNCSYQDSGCSFTGELSEMTAHEKTCVSHPLQCPLPPCDYCGSKKELIDHLKQHHKANPTLPCVLKINKDYEGCGYAPMITEIWNGACVVTLAKISKCGIFNVRSMSVSVAPQPGVSSGPQVKVTLDMLHDQNASDGYRTAHWSAMYRARPLRNEHGEDQLFCSESLSPLMVSNDLIANYGPQAILKIVVS